MPPKHDGGIFKMTYRWNMFRKQKPYEMTSTD